MSTITTIQTTDLITNSRAVINTNFSNLNTDKMETSVLDTDTALTADSDAKVPSQKAIKAYVDRLGTLDFVPSGAVLSFASATPPTGYLLCDGSAVSRSTYATLFGVISTNFGVGNGSTTFNIPDLRSRFIVGSGSAGTKVYTFVSRASNVITASGMANSTTNENQTGQAVVYTTTGDPITGLTSTTTYYLVRVTYNTFSLATSLANAQNGTVITLSGDGTGTQTFTFTLTARTLADSGGEETHAISLSELLAHTHTEKENTAGVGTSGKAFQQLTTNPAISDSGFVTGSTGGNVAMNNMAPFVALAYIIKT